MKQGYILEDPNDQEQLTSQLVGGHPRLIDWLLTPLFLVFFLTNLCLFEVLFRLRALFPGEFGYQPLFRGINAGVMLALRLAGISLRVHKAESVELAKKFSNLVIVISNHQSMFDIPFLVLALPELRLRFVAKKELARGIPGISLALRSGGHSIIDRADPKQALPELERMTERSLGLNYAITVFPEGTRSRDGSLRAFKSGGVARLVKSAGKVTVLPVVIDGSWKITRYSLRPIGALSQVSVTILPPSVLIADSDIQPELDRIRDQMQTHIEGFQRKS